MRVWCRCGLCLSVVMADPSAQRPGGRPVPRVPRRTIDKPNVKHITERELTVFTDKPLGNGSYGEVFQGRYNSTDVAVKMFFQKQIGQQSRSNTFDRERDTLSRIHNHQNVIDLYGIGDNGVKQFMVMELAPMSMDRVGHAPLNVHVTSWDYAAVLHGQGPPRYEYYADHVIGWGVQLARALEFIHSHDIIHRDIKPSNILLFDEARLLKLCDFGTAKVLEQSTMSGTLAGTAFYIAPEVMHSVASRQCDIFSFAITFWEMITRHKPCLDVDGDNVPHSYAIMLRMDKGDRPPLIKGIPKFLSELLVKCWDKDPKKRLTSAELLDKLTRASQYFEHDLPIVDPCKPPPPRKRTRTSVSGTTQPPPKGVSRFVSNQETKRTTHAPTPIIVDEIPPSQFDRSHHPYPPPDPHVTPSSYMARPPSPLGHAQLQQAAPGTRYFIGGLEAELQPIVPLEGDDESMQLYYEYKSCAEQKLRMVEEINSNQNYLHQLESEIQVEQQRIERSKQSAHEYQALLQDKAELELRLDDLKQRKRQLETHKHY